MSKSKQSKYEKGQSRPTENRAVNSMVSEEARKWVAKLDACDLDIKSGALVLEALIREIEAKRVADSVLEEVLKRRNVKASVKLVLERRDKDGRQANKVSHR